MTEIYALACPVSGEIRYIGKANNCAERLKKHLHDSVRRKTPVYAWIRKLAKQGQSPVMIHLCTALNGSWKELEKIVIAQYRESHSRLLNVADGGDEPFCPDDVRRANGRLVAGSRDKKRWALLRKAGSEAKWFSSRGDQDRADRLSACVGLIRAMPQASIDKLYERFCA